MSMFHLPSIPTSSFFTDPFLELFDALDAGFSVEVADTAFPEPPVRSTILLLQLLAPLSTSRHILALLSVRPLHHPALLLLSLMLSLYLILHYCIALLG